MNETVKPDFKTKNCATVIIFRDFFTLRWKSVTGFRQMMFPNSQKGQMKVYLITPKLDFLKKEAK